MAHDPVHAQLPVDPGFADVVRQRAHHRRRGARDRDFVRVLDLDAQVCPNHQFRSAYGGVDPARPDGNHFSDDGALAAARWMSPILLGDVAPPTRVQRLDPPR